MGKGVATLGQLVSCTEEKYSLHRWDCQVCGQMGARDHFLRPRTPDRLRQLALPPLLCSVGLTPQDPTPGTAFQPTPGWRVSQPRSLSKWDGGSKLNTLCSAGDKPQSGHVLVFLVSAPHQGQCQTRARSSPPLSFCMNVRNSSFCLFIWPKIACRGYGYLEVFGGFFVCLVFCFWVFVLFFLLWFNRSGVRA